MGQFLQRGGITASGHQRRHDTRQTCHVADFVSFVRGLKPVEEKIHPEIGIDGSNVQKHVDQVFGRPADDPLPRRRTASSPIDTIAYSAGMY